MKFQKVGINFSKYTDADFLTKAQHILVSLTGNPAFPDPIPTLTEISIGINNFSQALIAAEGLGRTNVAEKNKCRQALELLLAQLGLFVMFVANGDVAILTSSGYTLNKEPEPRYITNPGNVTLQNGVTPGQLVASVTRVKGASHFLHEISAELPTDATQWDVTVSSRCKFVYSDLQPGKQYWVRIAAVGGGEQIAYSTIATQFVQ